MKIAAAILVALTLLAGCRGSGETKPDPAPASGPGTPAATAPKEAGPGSATARMKLYYDLDQYTNQWMTARAQGNSVTWSSLERSVLRPAVDRSIDDLLGTLTSSEEGRLRVIAARAVGFGSASDRIVPALLSVLGEQDANLVSSALVSLYVLADPATPLPPLAELLVHPDEDVRVNDTLALYAVIRARRKDGQVPLTEEVKAASGRLLALVSTAGEDPFVRAHAAAALGEIGDPMATDVLLNLLDDPSDAVRTRAAEGLGQLGREQAIPPLLDALDRAKKPMEKQVVAASLAAIAGKANLPVDAGALGTEPSSWRAWYMAVKRPATE